MNILKTLKELGKRRRAMAWPALYARLTRGDREKRKAPRCRRTSLSRGYLDAVTLQV